MLYIDSVHIQVEYWYINNYNTLSVIIFIVVLHWDSVLTLVDSVYTNGV